MDNFDEKYVQSMIFRGSDLNSIAISSTVVDIMYNNPSVMDARANNPEIIHASIILDYFEFPYEK